MKEHLNVNSQSHHSIWMSTASPVKATSTSNSVGLAETQTYPESHFNLSDINEQLKFVRLQSTLPEGRLLMTAAHDSVSEDLVLNLFS